MQRNTSKQARYLVLVAMLASACSGSTGSPGGSDPSAPSNLVAGPLGGGVHLTWEDNSEDEEAFDIERKQGSNAFGVIDSVPFNTNLYHDSAVTFGQQYTYRVRAKLAAGFSAYSNEATADPGGGGGGTSGQAAGTGGAGMNGAGTSGAGTGGAGGTGGQAGAAGSGGTNVSDAGTAMEVSFNTDIVPSLVQSCGSTTNGCHNADQGVGRIMPQFGPCKVIWFSAVNEPVGATYISGPNQGQPTGCPDLTLHERLMEMHSMLCDAATWDARARYVVPGDLDKSLLYQVIAGDPSMGGVCNDMGTPVARMPKVDPAVLPNGVPLSSDAIDKIRDWILQGAPNN